MKTLFAAYILSLTIFAVIFCQQLSHPFVFDDIAKILDNPDLKSPSLSLSGLFPDYGPAPMQFHNDPSRPLTYALYWLCWQLGEGASWPFHSLNGMLHLAFALLGGALAAQLSVGHKPWSRYWITTVLLLLPLNMHVAIYAYGLSDVLAGVLSLAACLTFLHAKEGPSPHKQVLLNGLGSMLTLFAIATKQTGILILPLLVLMEWWRPQTRHLKIRSIHYLLAGCVLVYLMLRYALFGTIGDREAFDHFPPLTYLKVQGFVILKYIGAMLAPWTISIDHDLTTQSHSDVAYYSSWVAIFFLTVFCWRRRTTFAFAWLFFLISVLPTSSIFPTTDLMVERRAYLGSFAFAWFIGQMQGVTNKRLPLFVCIGLALTWLGFWSERVVAPFSSNEKLWTHVLQIYPNNTRAQLNLSNEWIYQKRYHEAEELLVELLRQYPNYSIALNNLGALLHFGDNPKHDLQRAFELYERALSVDPADTRALSNMGHLMLDLKQPQKAEQYAARLLELLPRSSKAHQLAAKAAWARGLRSLAHQRMQKSIELDPLNESARKEMRLWEQQKQGFD